MATTKQKKPTTAQIERVAEVLYDAFSSAEVHWERTGEPGQHPWMRYSVALRPKDARELAERLVEALR